jgi:allantoinase
MKVSPPIRSGVREALWREVLAGRVALVSSDHSSWPSDNKDTPSIFEAGAGVPGVETLLPAFHTIAAKEGPAGALLTARMLSEGPARLFGLWPKKGAIRVGADADLAIYAPGQAAWDETAAHDGLCWSPFHGRIFDGRVVRTYLRGRLVWDGSTVIGRPGDGSFLPRLMAGALEDESRRRRS